jgi:uncharacterized protein (TIGR02145 family)
MKNLYFAVAFCLGIVSITYSQTVTIGTQVWTTKNLDVSTFRNGEIIPEAKTNIEWEAAGKNRQAAWCYYNNDSTNGTKYGKLYNLYAVWDIRGLAPNGYHVPTSEEWEVLEKSIDEVLGGDKMKSAPVYGPTKISYVEEGGYYDENWVYCSNCINWNSEYKKKVPCHICKDERGKFVKGKYIPKTKKRVEEKGAQIGGWNGNNSSGFSALPGGYRGIDGDFENVYDGYDYNYWWCWNIHQSYESKKRERIKLNLYYSGVDDKTVNYFYDSGGFYVRCVRD